MLLLNIIIILALLVTLGILLTGVFTMGRAGLENRRWSNKLMRLRIVAQFTAIFLILIFAILNS